MFKIEKGIDIPPVDRKYKPRRSKYPWNEMEVGDSFVVKDYKKTKLGFATPISGLGNTFMKSRGAAKRFSQRETSEGLRVWRVA